MKNTDVESEIDELRPEYKRSDFAKFDRGAVTQVEFSERVSILLACIGEEENLNFVLQTFGSVGAEHQRGDWTYEIDNGNQVTLRYWLNSLGNIEINVTNPPCIFTAEDNNTLIDALTSGVSSLKAKVADHSSTIGPTVNRRSKV